MFRTILLWMFWVGFGHGEADITLNAEDVEDIYDEIALSEKVRNLDGNELSVFNEIEKQMIICLCC